MKTISPSGASAGERTCAEWHCVTGASVHAKTIFEACGTALEGWRCGTGVASATLIAGAGTASGTATARATGAGAAGNGGTGTAAPRRAVAPPSTNTHAKASGAASARTRVPRIALEDGREFGRPGQ